MNSGLNSWGDLEDYAGPVSAAGSGGAVEVALFVEDEAAVGLVAVLAIGELMEDAEFPWAIFRGGQFVNHGATATGCVGGAVKIACGVEHDSRMNDARAKFVQDGLLPSSLGWRELEDGAESESSVVGSCAVEVALAVQDQVGSGSASVGAVEIVEHAFGPSAALRCEFEGHAAAGGKPPKQPNLVSPPAMVVP